MKKYFVSALVFVALLTGCGRAPAEEITYTEFIAQASPFIQFSYPETWVNNPNDLAAIAHVNAPGEVGIPSLSVFREIVAQSPDPVTYGTEALVRTAEIIPQYALIQSGEVSLGSRKAFRVEYEGIMGTQTLRWIQWYVVDGVDVYVLTGMMTTVSADVFVPVFDHIAGTFTIK